MNASTLKPAYQNGAPALTSSPLNQPQKAAIIIGLLGADHARPIVSKLEDSHLSVFMETLSGLYEVPRPVLLSVMADFITELTAHKGAFRGGPDAVERFVNEVFEGDRVARMTKPSPSNAQDMSTEEIWAAVKSSDRVKLVMYLCAQRSEVVGIILSAFSPEESGEILSDLPDDLALSCVNYMSRSEKADGQTIDMIAQFIRDDYLLSGDDSQEQELVSFMSELLGVMPKERRDLMLEALEQNDPEKSEKIKAAMLTFEDLPRRLPPSAIAILFKDYPPVELPKMLKAGGELFEDTVSFFYANLPQRMGAQLKEQVEESGALSPKEAEKAISSFMSFVGKQEKSGRVTLIKVAAPPEGEG